MSLYLIIFMSLTLLPVSYGCNHRVESLRGASSVLEVSVRFATVRHCGLCVLSHYTVAGLPRGRLRKVKVQKMDDDLALE